MVYIPNEILLKIYEFSNFEDLQIIKHVNLFSYYFSIIRSKQLFIRNNFPLNIQSFFTNINYDEIQFLPFKHSFVGDSNYIDSVTIEDLEEIHPTAPIFIGKDNINRPFIALKMDIIIYNKFINNLINNYNDLNKDNKHETPIDIEDKDILLENILEEKICSYRFVNVLFKRYSNLNAYGWCVASKYNLIDFTNVYLQEKDFIIYDTIFKTLLNNNSLVNFSYNGMITNESHSFCSLQDDCKCLFCEITSSDEDEFDEQDSRKTIYSIRLS